MAVRGTVLRIANAIDAVNATVGKAAAWLAVLMVLVQFLVVLLRYVFSINFIFMQESVVYLHATLFMMGAAYTLLHEGHVRVDIFYSNASRRTKACVDLTGSLLFLLPVCALILYTGWPYVVRSWGIWEGSVETSGIPLVYVRKSLILAFAALLALQGIALALRALLTLTDHPSSDTDTDLDGMQV